MNEKLVGLKEVADHLGMSESFVQKAIYRHDLPVWRVGRRVRFRLSEIDAWIERTRDES
jgi:excisionase family DNA binding protein